MLFMYSGKEVADGILGVRILGFNAGKFEAIKATKRPPQVVSKGKNGTRASSEPPGFCSITMHSMRNTIRVPTM